MNNTEQNIPQNLQIEKILNRFLNSRSTAAGSHVSQDSHLDEDLLSAFVEGSLNRRESNAAVKHLADCSFCRQMTTELIKMDFVFADETAKSYAKVGNNEPSKISEVLSGLMSRLFGSGEAAVFAHEEKPENETGKEPENEK